MLIENFKKENDLLRHIMTVEKNEEQGRALKQIFTTRDHLFITGKAGSGKSTFMRRVREFLRNSVTVAPTGIAALNAGGQTIHSFFLMKTEPYIPEIYKGMLKNKVEVDYFTKIKLKSVDTIIIDEISMVRPDTLDYMSDIIRQAKKSRLPFGGVRLIMFGDLSQLPPVVTEDDFLDKHYESRFFFSSKALRASGFRVIQFNRVYRQTDNELVSALDDIRCGVLTEETRTTLESRVKQPEDIEKTIIICATNKEASKINNENLDRIPSELFEIRAESNGQPPIAPCEDTLYIKEGAKVVITKNGDGYVNGSMGVVREILINKGKIVVELPDGFEVEIYKNKWEKIKYTQVDGELKGVPVGYVIQFPIRLGYAITAHKSQGMTLESVYVDMSRSFEIGQVYTAISRCKSLDGLYLKSMIEDRSIILSDKVSEFMEKVDECDNVIPPEKLSDINNEMIERNKDLFNFEEFGL